MRLTLEKRPTLVLSEYAANAKRHSQSDVEAIAASITRFGFNDPIGITPDGVVVEGHGRLAAANLLGLTDVPVLVLHDVTERDIDLYRIAHNKIAQVTGFDPNLLAVCLREVIIQDGQEDISAASLGFTEDMVTSMLSFFPEGGQQSGGTRRAPTALTYDIAWDTAEQKKKFDGWFKRLVKTHGGTPGEAMTRFIADTGIVRPVVSETVPETAADGDFHEHA